MFTAVLIDKTLTSIHLSLHLTADAQHQGIASHNMFWFGVKYNGMIPIVPSFVGNGMFHFNYHQTSNISRTLVGNKIVDHSDVVGASPVGAALTISSFTT